MAQYYGLASDMPEESSERLVSTALQTLPEDWIVFHHVSWQSRRKGRQGDGEADFIVLQPKRGILVLEVKGGGINILNGRWSSTDRHGDVHPIKNPYEQATDSKYALLEWLADLGLSPNIRVGHAVVFPNLHNVPPLGPAGTQPITLTGPDLASPLDAIDRCYTHWKLEADLTKAEVSKLVSFLAPTVLVRRTLFEASAEAEEKILTLTAEQVSIFAGLRAKRGGLVLGSAGTGKTVLAIARAQQLAKDGFRTLLVCYNELLGTELASRVGDPPNLIVSTYHSLCLKKAREAKLHIPSNKPSEWWEVDAPSLLIEACAVTSSYFDAIVVDEGQDFSPEWIASLRCLTASAAEPPFFIFADPMQEIWGRNWQGDTSAEFCWQLTRNLRNTQPIADRVSATVGLKSGAARGAPGPRPFWRDVCDKRSVDREVFAVVERLLNEGFGPKTLAVLCCSHELVARLREHIVGSFSFGRWGSAGIPVETVARFKGMEAEAVVLVLSEGMTDKARIEDYVGMSRARSVLAVVGPPQLQGFLNWAP